MKKNSNQTSAKFLLLFVIFLGSLQGYCTDTTANRLKRNIAFATFSGKENFGSLNYERIFSEGRKLNWSVSAGVQPFELSRKFSVPLSFNVFTTGRLHHLELDFTATFYMDKFHPYNNGWRDEFNKQLYLTPFVCYRLQRGSGFVFKTGIGPQWLLDPPAKDVLAPRTTFIFPAVFGAIGISF